MAFINKLVDILLNYKQRDNSNAKQERLESDFKNGALQQHNKIF